jgi:preprotein translocase subunit SecY
MNNSSKKNRSFKKHYDLVLSSLFSLSGLIFYWFLKFYLNGKRKGFFLGTTIHSSINFALASLVELFFLAASSSFISKKRANNLQLRKWKKIVSRVLIFLVCFLSPVFQSKSHLADVFVKQGLLSLCLLSVVINFCLFEMIIKFMNQYGICDSYSLIFFTELIFRSEVKFDNFSFITNLSNISILFLLSSLFVWATDMKWEVPVETNRLYSIDNQLEKEKKFNLSFKLNFSLYSFTFLGFFMTLMDSYFNFSRSTNAWKRIFWDASKENDFLLGKRIFSLLKSETKLNIFSALVLLTALRLTFSWLIISTQQLNAKEISKDLRERGIYIDSTPSGYPTRLLLTKIIRKLIFLWFSLIFLFNLAFESIDSKWSERIDFINWFHAINIGFDLIKKIEIKLKYIGIDE